MTLGCSLPIALFTAEILPPDLSALAPQDDRQALVRALWQHGVRSVELHGVGSHTDSAALCRAAAICYEGGMTLTLHGILCDKETPSVFFAPYLPLLAQGKQPFYLVTLHGLQDAVVTTQRLKALVSYATEHRLAVHFILENDHRNHEKNAADCCGGVEQIVNDLSCVDVCWDMGHYYSNVLTKEEAGPLPSDTFLGQVRHTHIHAVGAHDMHLPFSQGELPLTPYLAALNAVGYDGAANVELSPSRFYQTEDPFAAYLDTVDILQNALFSLG